jgi:hypothetical protein
MLFLEEYNDPGEHSSLVLINSQDVIFHGPCGYSSETKFMT